MSKADFMKFLPKKPPKKLEHRYVLRLSPELWERLAKEAQSMKVSVNDFLLAAIKSAIGGK